MVDIAAASAYWTIVDESSRNVASTEAVETSQSSSSVDGNQWPLYGRLTATSWNASSVWRARCFQQPALFIVFSSLYWSVQLFHRRTVPSFFFFRSFLLYVILFLLLDFFFFSILVAKSSLLDSSSSSDGKRGVGVGQFLVF